MVPQDRTNGGSRLSILEARRRQRLVDAPLLERVAGENMRQLEIKAGSARKITGSPAVPSCSERGEVVESFRFVFLLVFSRSTRIGMRVHNSSRSRKNVRALNRSYESYAKEDLARGISININSRCYIRYNILNCNNLNINIRIIYCLI